MSKKQIEEAAARGTTQETVIPETNDGAIIVDGKKIVLPGVKVHTWHDHDMQYTTENTAVARDLKLLRWILLHWTASERNGLEGAKKIFESLKNRGRGLSVEFFVDNDGTIWQFADPAEVRCRHASRLNPYSIGFEVSNVGWLEDMSSARGTTREREITPVRIHGWRTKCFNYLPAQQNAVNHAVKALLDAFDLPYNVLLDPWYARTDKELFKMKKGVCGHLHCVDQANGTKIDPGMVPLENLNVFLSNR